MLLLWPPKITPTSIIESAEGALCGACTGTHARVTLRACSAGYQAELPCSARGSRDMRLPSIFAAAIFRCTTCTTCSVIGISTPLAFAEFQNRLAALDAFAGLLGLFDRLFDGQSVRGFHRRCSLGAATMCKWRSVTTRRAPGMSGLAPSAAPRQRSPQSTSDQRRLGIFTVTKSKCHAVLANAMTFLTAPPTSVPTTSSVQYGPEVDS